RRGARVAAAAMEPGLRDRGHLAGLVPEQPGDAGPQWSPVFATGVTWPVTRVRAHKVRRPQWRPVLATGVTRRASPAGGVAARPQWSPVFATGVTSRLLRHETPGQPRPQWSPVFATGVTSGGGGSGSPAAGRNGAR